MTPTPDALHGDFSSLFNFLPIGAYRTGPDGTMLRVNPAFVSLAGYRDEAQMLADMNSSDEGWYVVPRRRAEFRRLLDRDGFVRGFVSEVERFGSGDTFWVSENAHLVRDAQGRPLYYEGTVEDVSERVRDQQRLRQSEERLRLTTDQVPGMVYSLFIGFNGQRAYRFASSGVREIYGFGPDELMRDPGLVVRYRHPEDAPVLERESDAIHAGPVQLEGEFRIVRPDGQVRWVYKRSTEVSRDAQGVLRAGVLLDITARKQAEAALHESEALWRLALEGAGDGVWDWNIATGEEFFSSSIKRMFGYADDEIANLSSELDARTHPDDVPQMQADRQAHFEGRVPVYRNEHRVRCKDGQWKWVLSRGVIIARDEAGRPLRMVGTHTDITDLKAAEEQQRQLEMQLRESQKMEAIGTLAGGVAHDFNNLLAAILGNLALAREDVGPGHPAQESLGEINRAAIRARQLVQQILTFSRRQAQAMQRQPLRPLVEEALGLMRAVLPAGVRLATRLPAAPLPVLADATQVQQVLMNLCTNAWQAFDGAAGDITVALAEVRLDPAWALKLGNVPPGDYARLSVADNGPGIDEVTQRRVFEPFFTTKAPGAGTGLGLAVVHGIVKAHRGAVELHSRPGEGTRFDIFLPLAPGGPEASAGDAPVPAPAPEPPAAPGRHVVYVDDYEALVFLVGRLLKKQGYRVTTFESGHAAIDWLAAHPDEPVDLWVTDQNMPVLSGVDVAREVLRLRPALRVAIVSGHVSDALVDEARRAGVHEVLGKQDNMDALGRAIRGLLDGA